MSMRRLGSRQVCRHNARRQRKKLLRSSDIPVTLNVTQSLPYQRFLSTMCPGQFDRYLVSRKGPTFLYKTKKHDESESEPVLVSVEGLVHKYGLSKKTARLVAIEIAHLAH
jgi:hypothetical protein